MICSNRSTFSVQGAAFGSDAVAEAEGSESACRGSGGWGIFVLILFFDIVSVSRHRQVAMRAIGVTR
jgi:hypothetical protein